MDDDTRDHGEQPLSALMGRWNLSHHDLVEASTEQLTHKQVQRARKGRQLTLHLMQKTARALNIAIWSRLNKNQRESYFEYQHRHLFHYAKGHETAWVDPNITLARDVAGEEGGK